MPDLASLLNDLCGELGVESDALRRRIVEVLGAPRLDARLALDADDAAVALGISTRHLANLVARGLCPPPVKLGSRRVFSVASLRRWIDSGCEIAQPAAGDRASVGSAETSANRQSDRVISVDADRGAEH